MANSNIPKDPVMLLSFINMKLRDFYDSLDALCIRKTGICRL